MTVVQQVFVTPLNYMRESMSSATNLSVFLPMLDESSFVAKLLGTIDLFLVWWVFILAIGLSVLYRRKTSSIATGLFVVLRHCGHHHRGGHVWPRGSVSVNAKKIIIGVAILVVGAGLVGANIYFKRDTGVTVQVEKLEKRSLEAIVSASGKIQARTTINISANTMGRVVKLEVEEGDIVKTGPVPPADRPAQPPDRGRPRRSRHHHAAHGRRPGSCAAGVVEDPAEARAGPAEAPAGPVARPTDDERSPGSRRERGPRARARDRPASVRNLDADDAESVRATRISKTREYSLSQVTIDSPIDGIVTRRNIELGETAVTGTMNNAGTVLLTIADMSVIETELEVDETDIPNLKLGQIAKVTIDAIPDKTFPGKVTEIGNSPIQAAASATTRATNFKVVVTLDGQIPEVRPGFTCTADITTATREDVLSIPIQATTVRELVYDEKGNVVKEPEADAKNRRPGAKAAVAELKKGQTKKETEGVFLIKDAKAVFVPVKTGIAGEKYFEALSGVKVGDEVITGPFNSVRDLKDGSAVKLEATKK